jgi:hypothetical protein
MKELLPAGFSAGFSAAAGQMDAQIPPGRDLFVVAKYLVPMDAYLVQGCLVAGGVPAVVADVHHAQLDLLMAPALGGVRLLAPLSHLQQAQDIIAAFERGEFALDEDADVGNAG